MMSGGGTLGDRGSCVAAETAVRFEAPSGPSAGPGAPRRCNGLDKDMSDTPAGSGPGATPSARYQGDHATEQTGWVGWIIFGGVVMIVLGAFQVITGLVALFQKSFYLVATSHLIVHASYTTWGWTHLIIGAIIVLVGFGILTGQLWARVTGIGLAVISAIVNLAFIAAYPVWGIIIIALDIVVIYALAVHGREMSYS
jgi:hypothetical protein